MSIQEAKAQVGRMVRIKRTDGAGFHHGGKLVGVEGGQALVVPVGHDHPVKVQLPLIRMWKSRNAKLEEWGQIPRKDQPMQNVAAQAPRAIRISPPLEDRPFNNGRGAPFPDPIPAKPAAGEGGSLVDAARELEAAGSDLKTAREMEAEAASMRKAAEGRVASATARMHSLMKALA